MNVESNLGELEQIVEALDQKHDALSSGGAEVLPELQGGMTNSPASTSVGGVQATIGSLETNGCKPLSPASRFSGATLSTL